MVLESILLAAQRFGFRNDDDNIDRLHYFITSNLLIGMALLVSWKQFGGKPIECMTPPKFPGAWEDYAENYCWAQDTYMVPFDSRLPKTTGSRAASRISYYQWVPFFLIFQAACFRLPSILYKFLMAKSGITVHDLVDIGLNPQNINPATRKESIRSLTTYLQGALRFHRRLERKSVTPYNVLLCLNLPFTSFFVTMVYVFCKLLYLINGYLMFVLLNQFLETDGYDYYGYRALQDILNGTTWEQSKVFPRVTICDFQVRGDSANVQRYSVQCVLVINIFNEKIFIFLWFWYLCLMFVTIFGVLEWLYLVIFPWPARNFVSRHLEMSDMVFDPVLSHPDVKRFVDKYLHSDGMFVLRMITSHAGAIFGTELVLALWREFYHIEEYRRVSSDVASRSPTTYATTPITPSAPYRIEGDSDDDDKLCGFAALRRRPKMFKEKDKGPDQDDSLLLHNKNPDYTKNDLQSRLLSLNREYKTMDENDLRDSASPRSDDPPSGADGYPSSNASTVKMAQVYTNNNPKANNRPMVRHISLVDHPV